MWGSAISALLGAVVGSLTAGLISWWLQRQNLREARKMREEEKLERDKALGKAVFMKMIHVQTVFFHMYDYFQQRIKWAEEARNPDVSAYTQALANMPASENFTYEELGFLLGIKNNDLFNLIWSMNSRLRDLLNIIETFNTSRTKFEEEIQLFIRGVEGMEAQVLIPEDSKAKIQIKKNALNELIASIHPMAEAGLNDATKALADLEAALNLVLKLGVRFEETGSKISEEAPQQNGD